MGKNNVEPLVIYHKPQFTNHCLNTHTYSATHKAMVMFECVTVVECVCKHYESVLGYVRVCDASSVCVWKHYESVLGCVRVLC